MVGYGVCVIWETKCIATQARARQTKRHVMDADTAFTIYYTVELLVGAGLWGGLFVALFGLVYMKPSKDH